MGSNPPSFSGPPQRISFQGLLFDMDGTLIDSTAAVEKHWHSVGEELGVDPLVILQTSHGRRSMDVLKVVKPSHANWEYIKNMEGKLPVLYGDDAVEIPGARDLLRSVTEHHVPWAIVTSGTSPLVNGWMSVLNMTIPEHLVAAEDVQDGKPDPTCYLMGKQKLGIQDAANVLVLEDSPAGILAGKAAGCRVLAVVTSHTAEQVAAAEPDWIVKDLESVKIIQGSEKGVELEISNILDAKKVRGA